jgi:hypothetical protein
MASERPICECGHEEKDHRACGVQKGGVKRVCFATDEENIPVCDCEDYRPAATTPERDAVNVLKRLRIRADEMVSRSANDNDAGEWAKAIRAIDAVLAALTPRDEPAAATDGTLEARIMALPENGKVIAFTSDSNPFCNAQFTHAELKALVARRADPTPEVRRRIEGESKTNGR